jgi:hypothetical protein
MVLAYQGRKHNERELTQIMGTVRGLGTNPESAMAAWNGLAIVRFGSRMQPWSASWIFWRMIGL